MNNGQQFELNHNLDHIFNGTPYVLNGNILLGPDTNNPGSMCKYGECYSQHDFYDIFIREHIPGAPDPKDLRSRDKKIKEAAKTQLYTSLGWDTVKYPDVAVYNDSNPYHKILYVLEVKYQEGEGTAYEKLSGATWLHSLYENVGICIGAEVRFGYILSDYFRKFPGLLNYLRQYSIPFWIENDPHISWFNL